MNPLRILVVEDEILVARDLDRSLRRQGFEITGLCRTGEEALESVRRDPPQVVLMDIRLASEVDGIETASRLRGEWGLPVVFLTGHADEETITRAGAAQPYGYLVKPFHESELRPALELAHARHESLTQLQASGERLRATLHSMAEGVIATNLLGMVHFMNPVAEALTGWSLREAAGRPLREIFRVSLPNGEALEAAGLMMPDKGPLPRTIVLTDRSGQRLHIEDRTNPIRDEEGSLTGIVVLFRRRNATAPAPAAASASVSISRTGAGMAAAEVFPEPLDSLPWPDLSGIVGSISDPLLAVDADWRITWLNPLAAAVLDSPDHAAEMTGRVLWDCLPPSLHRRHYHEFSTALTKREACSFEMEHGPRGLWFGVQLYPFEGGLLALLRDITVQRRAEEERSKLEKLENLGLLARGFAHDFNNLLTVLLGNLSLAESRTNPQPQPQSASRGQHTHLSSGSANGDDGAVAAAGLGPGLGEELRGALRAGEQARNLVQQLLIFARGGAPIRRLTDPARLVREWFAEWQGRGDTEYRLSLPEETWQMNWDRHQLRRVLANLVKNAEQALSASKGSPRRISITLKQSTRSAAWEESGGAMAAAAAAADGLRDSSANGGGDAAGAADLWLVLEVADSGEGMDADTLKQALEPYFTTRGQSNATGLGLTVCEAVVKAHEGLLRISSQAGAGTRVRALFPLTAADSLAGGPVERPERPLGTVASARGIQDSEGERAGSGKSGTGTISQETPGPPGQTIRRVLILEDEPAIRQLLRRLLERMGYEVTASAEGSEAVRIYAENFAAGRTFDLVIMDLSIPGGMGGAQAMENIRKLDPEVLAIVSSGYSDDPVMSRHTDYGFRAVLPKPYQASELRDLLEDLMPR